MRMLVAPAFLLSGFMACDGRIGSAPHEAGGDAGGAGDAPTNRYHPQNYALPALHGQEAKLQVQRCQDCHGDDLEGGEALACSSACHGGGSTWTSNCMWCHGSDTTGLPPEDIDDSAPDDLSFPAHAAHASGRIAAAYDCVECHDKPTDAFSIGHLFVGDTTPAVAEVTFELGSFGSGSYTGTSCSVLCHGDGTGPGSIARTDGPRGCDGCHDAGPNAGQLSARHDTHLDEDLECGECHGGTVSGYDTIVGKAQHVNGVVDVALPEGMARVDGQCSGTCHGEEHDGRVWDD